MGFAYEISSPLVWGCEILSRVNNQLDEDVTAPTAGSDTVTFGRDE